MSEREQLGPPPVEALSDLSWARVERGLWARLDGTVRALRRERDRGQEHLADVSHELRTPLAALRAFVDLLEGLRQVVEDEAVVDVRPADQDVVQLRQDCRRRANRHHRTCILVASR